MAIDYFSEDTEFVLSEMDSYTDWIEKIASSYDAKINQINYIFCSESYLLKINQDYLNHDYHTDIISFPYSASPAPIEGDIFISIKMVKENSVHNNVTFENELLRVMAHGILHFLGFKDKTEYESTEMRRKEEVAISLFQ